MTYIKWIPSKEETKYLELIPTMTTDCLMKSGTDSYKTYVSNLRNIADGIDKIERNSQDSSSKSI